MSSDALQMLKRDHARVQQMIEKLASAEPGDGRQTLLHELDQELSLHLTFEEEHVYPLIEELEVGMAEEANAEHRLTRQNLATVTELADRPGFGAAVDAFASGISHHVNDEETKVFPMLRQRLDESRLISVSEMLIDAKRSADLLAPSDASKSELMELAQHMGIEGRSAMSKNELRDALRAG